MIALSQCAKFAKLSSNELILGVSPSSRHFSLLESYRLNLGLGSKTVRRMIVGDLRGFLDLGVPHKAADTLLVLRLFLTDHPAARLEPLAAQSTGAEFDRRSAWRRGRAQRGVLAWRAARSFAPAIAVAPAPSCVTG